VHSGPGGMASGDQGTQKQLLRTLVERVQTRGTPGRLGSRLGLSLGQQPQRRLAKFLLIAA
jgi:hypothetical protein